MLLYFEAPERTQNLKSKREKGTRAGLKRGGERRGREKGRKERGKEVQIV